MQPDDPYSYRLPKRINEPLTLIYWPVHYVAIPLMSVGFGIIINKTLPLLFIGIFWFFLIKWLEARFPRGFLNHFLWWNGLGFHIKETKSTPDAYKREYYQ
jgi:conjugal transfer pilus assembly protein TraL